MGNISYKKGKKKLVNQKNRKRDLEDKRIKLDQKLFGDSPKIVLNKMRMKKIYKYILFL